MKIKVDKTSLIKYGVYLIFLLDICFWFLFPMETSFTGVYNKKLITIIVMLLAFVTVLATNFFWKKSFRFLLLFSLAYLFDWLALVMYSKSQYPAQGFGGTMAMAYYYLCIFISFPVLYVFCHDRREEVLLDCLNKMAIVLILLVLLQAFLYMIGGIVFLKGILNTDELAMRNGRIRIGMTNLGNFFLIYNFARIQQKKAKIWNYIGFVAGIICAYFVQMSRMCLVAIIGALLAMYLTSTKKAKRVVRISVVTFALVYICIVSGVLDKFLSTFDVNGELGASTRVRFEAIEYFLTFVNKNPLFGMGFVHSNYYNTVLYGADGRYFLSDVGIIGLLTECGSIMTGLYILFCVRMIYILYRTRKNSDSLLVGFCVFTVLCTPTLIIWARRTMIYIGLVLAMFEYRYYVFKHNIDGKI